MSEKTQILVLDDEKVIRDGIERHFTSLGYDVHVSGTWQEAKTILSSGQIQIIILDIVLQGLDGRSDGMQVLKHIKNEYPDIEVIMISAHATVDRVIGAWKSGAIMFLEKPYELDDLVLAVQRAEKYTKRWTRINQLEDSIVSIKMEKELGTSVIAKSPQMKKCLQMVVKYAPNQHSILLTGESGTGKDIFARLIHYTGNQRSRSFVPVNVTAIPHELFESTLFGYVKGAYTGAVKTTSGLVDKAAGGTLFLDEIGDLPMDLQVKLLRLIESREFYRVGDSNPERTDARFIFATMYDLKSKVDAGLFRNDLFYRISDLEINIPPLRERPQDIRALAEYFLVQISSEEGRQKPVIISPGAMKALLEYKFEGNIRELKKIIRKAVLISENSEIGADDLFPQKNDNFRVTGKKTKSCPDCEAHFIRKVLQATGCNASQTMKLLGISRAAFYAKLKAYGIEIKSEVVQDEK